MEDFQTHAGNLKEMTDTETTKQFFRRYSANDIPQSESRYLSLLIYV